jgi:hypothetical protein
MPLTTSNSPIGARVLIPLDKDGGVNYYDPSSDAGFIVATILSKGRIGTRNGEKYADCIYAPTSDDLKVDPAINMVRSASGIRCYPALNRRFLQCK